MELKLHCRRFTCSLYTVPKVSYRGLVAVWPGQHAGWRQGFVIRVLWFGFVARWNQRAGISGLESADARRLRRPLFEGNTMKIVEAEHPQAQWRVHSLDAEATRGEQMRFPIGLINILAGGLPNYSLNAPRPKYSRCADCGKPTKLQRCFRCEENESRLT